MSNPEMTLPKGDGTRGRTIGAHSIPETSQVEDGDRNFMSFLLKAGAEAGPISSEDISRNRFHAGLYSCSLCFKHSILSQGSASSVKESISGKFEYTSYRLTYFIVSKGTSLSSLSSSLGPNMAHSSKTQSFDSGKEIETGKMSCHVLWLWLKHI